MSEKPAGAAAQPDDERDGPGAERDGPGADRDRPSVGLGGQPDREAERGVEMLAAALRADLADLSVYARVLTHTLAGALPVGMVTVEQNRSLADRLARRPGTVTLLRVHTSTGYLELSTQPGDLPDAHIVVTVLGTEVSRRHLSVAQWTHRLAQVLSARASESTAARRALAELLEG